MAKNIIWSPSAKNDANLISDYLIKNWDNQVCNSFLIDIEQVINLISKNPKSFPIIHKKLNIRKLVITKHNSLFYRENKKNVEIIRILDSRQDPKKLTFK